MHNELKSCKEILAEKEAEVRIIRRERDEIM